MKKFLLGFSILMGLTAITGGTFFLKQTENVIKMESSATSSAAVIGQSLEQQDAPPQKPLANPPEIIKAVYSTAWSAGSKIQLDYLINLIKATELNAIVIDIKDYSGYVAYDMDVPQTGKYGAEQIKIPKINFLIKQLHDAGIYVIARITVFQDPVLAKARPDLAIHSKSKCRALGVSDADCSESSSTVWLDNKQLAWIDPAAEDAWDYNIAIAKDAASRGFDEINFDYVRFASDGNLNDMVFPIWDGQTLKHQVIKNFFAYLREQLPETKLSADLFGLSTIQQDDLGIGQIIEDAYQYFDFICPMVYPSHYASGFLNYKNPADYPYEVIKYSMDNALAKLTTYNLKLTMTSTTATSTATSTMTTPVQPSVVSGASSAKLRPWLQDFNLGATYDAKMVIKEIQAVYDAARLPEPTAQAVSGQASSTPQLINGWMLWNPSNVYTQGALNKEQ